MIVTCAEMVAAHDEMNVVHTIGNNVNALGEINERGVQARSCKTDFSICDIDP